MSRYAIFVSFHAIILLKFIIKRSGFFMFLSPVLMLSKNYAAFVLVLTVPAVYERYNEIIDKHVTNVYRCLQHIRVKLEHYIAMLRKLDLEKMQ